MSFIQFVKNNLVNSPYPLGLAFSKVPFSLRPGMGSIYSKRKKEIEHFERLGEEARKKEIFNRVKDIASYAFENIPFYKDKYIEHGFDPRTMDSFSDLVQIPIVGKKDFQSVDLEYRSAKVDKRYIVNTGGSSGKPLELYIQASSVGHEWAHIHKIWNKLDYDHTCLRVVFAGRADIADVVVYDSARHQINVDIYAGWQAVADKLDEEFERYSPSYLHGYPSAIFDFVIWLEDHKHPLLKKLRHRIKGVFLGSEFPSPILRSQAEEILGCESVSWYGHTERAVLAYEKNEKEIYHPFQTYGYAEAKSVEGGTKLIATSFYNYASPLIRYDTEDFISPNYDGEILSSFRITEGRNGEFILDKSGNKIYLTALIFGRHHELFNYVTNLQVHQAAEGQAIILFVPRDMEMPRSAELLFDDSNVDIDFDFRSIQKPYQTKSGKCPLLLKEI